MIESFSRKFVAFIQPKTDAITSNVYIQALYEAKTKTLPMVYVGAFLSLYGVLASLVGGLPDLAVLKDNTIGLISLFMVYMIPYFVLENRSSRKHRNIAGCTGLSLYMIMVKPVLEEQGHVFNFKHFGTDGMVVAIVAGLFVSFVFLKFEHFNQTKFYDFLSEDIADAIYTTLPILVSLLFVWFFVIFLDLDVYVFLAKLFTPLKHHAQTWYGFTLIVFIQTVLYSMGISSWILQPIFATGALLAISQNASGVAQNIYTVETTMAYIFLGGVGASLPLVILLMHSKVSKLRKFGQISLLPSIVNINEPVIFGFVTWNPILMIPMWVNGLVLPLFTYFVTRILFPHLLPTFESKLWYLPIGMSAVAVTHALSAIVLVVINFMIAMTIWYPFFKMYEKEVAEHIVEPHPDHQIVNEHLLD